MRRSACTHHHRKSQIVPHFSIRFLRFEFIIIIIFCSISNNDKSVLIKRNRKLRNHMSYNWQHNWRKHHGIIIFFLFAHKRNAVVMTGGWCLRSTLSFIDCYFCCILATARDVCRLVIGVCVCNRCLAAHAEHFCRYQQQIVGSGKNESCHMPHISVQTTKIYFSFFPHRII